MVGEVGEELFLEALERGSSIAMAQKLIRVSVSWNHDKCERDKEWALRVEEAQARAYDDALKSLKAGFADDWKAAESYLKRKHRQEWGDNQKIEAEISPVAAAILGLREDGEDWKKYDEVKE